MPSSSAPMRLDKMLSNLGYASRRHVAKLLREGILKVNGTSDVRPDAKVNHHEVTFDGAALDPVSLVIAVNKPTGYICSHKEQGALIFELLPERFMLRNPKLSCIGRLDKDSSGLIIITDDGILNHKITSPKHEIKKVYLVDLDRDLKGNEAALFASGTMQLPDDTDTLLPATLEVITPRQARITLQEGRNRQIRRMFEATGNSVASLKRLKIGAFDLGDIPEGEYSILNDSEISLLTAASVA